MPPFKPTAQQYQDSWKERIGKEQKANVQATAELTARQGEARVSHEATGGPDDDNISILSKQSKQSTGSRREAGASRQEGASMLSGVSGYSEISSRVSSSSAANRKLEQLQQQLESERKKRRELEHALKSANNPV